MRSKRRPAPWRRRALQRRIKRGIDIAVAGAGLCAASPVLVALTALQLRYHGWPAFFTQTRPGLGGQPFRMFKFRTMSNATDADGNLLPDAERLTRFGELLRASSLDELPELFNVLRGEMSLVGPRPLLMQYLDRYSEEQSRRHDMPPGITGLAAVRGRNNLDWATKFAIDVEYVDDWNLLLDLRILAETVRVVLRREGVSQEGHATMPEFMGRESGQPGKN